MNRYQNMFKKLYTNNEGCFMPFLMIADPSIEIFYKIIDIVITSGANALELGFPFSDPIADGITVQKSSQRVLKNKISILNCFNIIQEIRIKYTELPIGILVYANIVFNKGIKHFFELCKKNGIDSIVIPDIPIEESKIFIKYAKLNNISYIFICPPNAEKKLIQHIALKSTEYIYLISRTGVTGLKNKFIKPNINIIQTIKKYNTIPILQGFGISSTKEIQKSLSYGTSGIICGSKIIQLIEKHKNDINILFQKITILIKKFKKATKIIDKHNFLNI
ncbi:tryptophan synthase subunit alpha [Buchnera aphidicola]|uniref:tryptophan synthase subunit alpha n=1 Tax=Buchnera aphidicola TaxID=9 RepID=UPI003464DAE6